MTTTIGYYCDHEDEPLGKRTHLRENADGKKKPAGSSDPNVTKALTFGTWDYKRRKYDPPPCPRAIPLRVTAARLAAAKGQEATP